MLQSPGPLNWEIARQTAEQVALEGRRRARRRPGGDGAQFDGARPRRADARWSPRPASTARSPPPFAPSARKGWVDLHLAALRPVLEALATTLQRRHAALEEARRRRPASQRAAARHARAASRCSGNMLALLAPAAARRAGRLDDRLPGAARARSLRPAAPHGPAPTTPASAATNRVSPSSSPTSTSSRRRGRSTREDLRFYVALHEVVHAAVRSVPWVRELLVRLSIDYVSSYEIDPGVFESEFGDVDPSDPESLAAHGRRPERSSARCSPTASGRSLERCSGSRRCSRATPTS